MLPCVLDTPENVNMAPTTVVPDTLIARLLALQIGVEIWHEWSVSRCDKCHKKKILDNSYSILYDTHMKRRARFKKGKYVPTPRYPGRFPSPRNHVGASVHRCSDGREEEQERRQVMEPQTFSNLWSNLAPLLETGVIFGAALAIVLGVRCLVLRLFRRT